MPLSNLKTILIKMKKIVSILFLMIYNLGYTQPGEMRRNLNEYFRERDVIVIDSTSDLSRVNLLKNSSALVLDFEKIKELPKEFKEFNKTSYLYISFWKTGITDLSFINQFPNLTHLRINGFEGTKLAVEPLKLDSLQKIEISYCPRLEDIECIKNLSTINQIRINNCATIKQFPRFCKGNSVKQLIINHMSNGRYFNEDNPNHYNTSINNITYLEELEDLTLGSLTYINEIPNFLPKNIKRLEITGWALHHYKGDKIVLRSVENIKLYKQLKEIKLYHIYLEKFIGDFKKISLDNLIFSLIPNLTDISGAFTFKNINSMAIADCVKLRKISGNFCTSFNSIEIKNCKNVENIDFLFTCRKIKNLVFRNAEKIIFPNTNKMNNIPNIAISNDSQKIELYKEDNKWIKI
jgi:hypothetical protein